MDISITYTYQRGGNANDRRVYHNISHHHVISYPRMYELGALALCYLDRLERNDIDINARVELLAGINSLTTARVMSAVHAVILLEDTGRIIYHLPSYRSEIHACLSEIAWLPMNLFTGPKGDFRSDDPSQRYDSFPPNMPRKQRDAIQNIINGILKYCTSRIPNDRTKLDFISAGQTHQGIIAYAAVKDYCTVDEILDYADSRGEAPFIVVLDELEDPHNLGAIIRTAECAGVHGVIVPKRRSAGLSYTVSKASAGAVEYMRVARVTNIASLLDELKQRGVWVYGADMNGTDYQKCDFSGACAIVIGNEGKGISRLVREKCDVIVSLPMKGKINSLNASVAAGILMYSAMNNR